MSPISRLSLALATMAMTAQAALAMQSALVVNSTQDLPDATPLGDGHVDADLSLPGDQVTLRAAIQEANALGGTNIINVLPGTYRLGASGVLDVKDDLLIVGLGAAPSDVII